jgi:hypothetical protein
MISRTVALLIAGCLCVSGGAAEARVKAKPKRVAALDMSKVATDQQERLRNWRNARWTLGEAEQYDDGTDPNAISWRLRGAGFKMKMPIAFSN